MTVPLVSGTFFSSYVEYLDNSNDTESFTMDDLGNRSYVYLRGGANEKYAVDSGTNRHDKTTSGPNKVPGP